MKPLNQNKMEKTAVEWFAKRIQSDKIFNFENVLKQAKVWEKQQIIDARQSGIDATINGKSISNIDYYNETFKQQEQ
jgi:hypothetical protein